MRSVASMQWDINTHSCTLYSFTSLHRYRISFRFCLITHVGANWRWNWIETEWSKTQINNDNHRAWADEDHIKMRFHHCNEEFYEFNIFKSVRSHYAFKLLIIYWRIFALSWAPKKNFFWNKIYRRRFYVD